MGIQVHWFDEKHRIICFEFSGTWTWDELQTLMEDSSLMAASVNHKVDVLVDLTQNQSLPLGDLMYLRTMSRTAPVNWQRTILVSTNPFVVKLLSALMKLSPGLGERYRIVKTRDEGLEVIQHIHRDDHH